MANNTDDFVWGSELQGRGEMSKFDALIGLSIWMEPYAKRSPFHLKLAGLQLSSCCLRRPGFATILPAVSRWRAVGPSGRSLTVRRDEGIGTPGSRSPTTADNMMSDARNPAACDVIPKVADALRTPPPTKTQLLDQGLIFSRHMRAQKPPLCRKRLRRRSFTAISGDARFPDAP
ncbi:hypothetical protein QR680_015946 [Steinernema hermaphroditum]|uniref:Uncharacterized protein n=1 Tax=Steinernema hermaphroditum TaxID=289476 RepID=A0AA39LLG8_9BILA|nr:hypothetical protein QR680_015946 [Steinernema hermaphroditum]